MSALADRSGVIRVSPSMPRRRVFLLVCLYRIACGILLLSVAYAADSKYLPMVQGGVLLTVCVTYLGFAFFCVAVVDRMQKSPGPWLLLALIGDLAFLLPVLVKMRGSESLGILLLPQLAATGWLIRGRSAFLHPALAAIGLLGIAFYENFRGATDPSMLLQMAWQSFAYFVVTGLGLLLGAFNRASEDLAAQRGIDLANLEQVNQLVIRDMDGGVLVVDEAGIVRNRNAQADRILEREHFPLGNTRLADFSPPLSDIWQNWYSRNGVSNATLQLGDPPHALSIRIASVSPQRRGGSLIYVEDMRRAQNAAQQIKLAALGRLTASIAHEVRNPLSAINHATELLRENLEARPRNDADNRLLEIIHSNAQRISRLLQEVMQLNRRDRRQAQQIVLASCIANLIHDIATAEKLPAAIIGMQIPAHLSVWFDQGHLTQIIWNLVRNAMHYCQQSTGSIQLSSRPGHVNGTVILEIGDDGRGIPGELRTQVFEPFFTTRTGGTGLGLYLARELTEANGGQLELLESGSGARFRLTMPSATT
ncbi:MAG: HAMP domain-containing sensor histidine kinase [Betaproteobacteria bacterium]